MSRLQTNAIRHLGSTVDNLTLDNAGRVLLPNQPAVCAYKSSTHGSNGASATTVLWDTVGLNNGNCYNPSTGLFTCPVAGRYRITAHGINAVATNNGIFTYNQLYVNKNGGGYGGATYAYTDGYASCAGTWLVNCAAGDTLAITASSFYPSLNGMTIEYVG